MNLMPKGRQISPIHTHEKRGISRRRFLIGTVAGIAGLAATRFLPPLPGMSGILPTVGVASAGCDQTCNIRNGCSYVWWSTCACDYANTCYSDPDEDCVDQCTEPDLVEEWVLFKKWPHHPNYGDCECWYGTTCGAKKVLRIYCGGCC